MPAKVSISTAPRLPDGSALRPLCSILWSRLCGTMSSPARGFMPTTRLFPCSHPATEEPRQVDSGPMCAMAVPAPIPSRQRPDSPSRPTGAESIRRPISRASREFSRPMRMRDFIRSMKEAGSSKRPAGPTPGASSTTSLPPPIRPPQPRPFAASANSMRSKDKCAALRRRFGSRQDKHEPGQ
jgi:hypothetical protein